MPIRKVLQELGIEERGNYSKDDSYVIDLPDSDTFGKIYSKLDKNDDVEYLEDNSLLTVNNASMYYRYDDVQITLIADFLNDEYKVVANRV